MIATLNVRSQNHNSCEDTILVNETFDSISGGVFDGCSQGINSHWASQTHAYLFKDCKKPYLAGDIAYAWNGMRDLKARFNLTREHFQSTCILFRFDKMTKELAVRVLGDGLYYVNHVEYDNDTNDKVDYLGDYVDGTIEDLAAYVQRHPLKVYSDVSNFKICSDGIKRIEISQFRDEQTDPVAVLFKPPTSKNFLERMWNILKQKHFTVSDDLSIISYAEE